MRPSTLAVGCLLSIAPILGGAAVAGARQATPAIVGPAFFAVQVEDVEAMAAWYGRVFGLEVVNRLEAEDKRYLALSARSFVFRDPEGNRLQAFQGVAGRSDAGFSSGIVDLRTHPDFRSVAVQRQELAAARAFWAARRPANYEFAVFEGLRTFALYRVTGQSVERVLGNASDGFLSDNHTIDSLFETMESQMTPDGGHPVTTYDAEFGFPSCSTAPDRTFCTAVFRPFEGLDEVRGPFAWYRMEPCNTSQVGGASDVAVWSDGLALYDLFLFNGPDDYRRIRHQARLDPDALGAIFRAVQQSGFLDGTGGSRGRPDVIVNHGHAMRVTARSGERSRTVSACGESSVDPMLSGLAGRILALTGADLVRARR